MNIEKLKKAMILREKLNAKLMEKKIPAVLAENVTIEKEEDIDNIVTDIETKYNEGRLRLVKDK